MAAVFVYAGAVKLADPLTFVSDIEAYRLVAGWPAWAAAVYLPWLEIVVGLGLLWPRASRASAGVIAGLMVVFTAALVSAWWRGLDLRCGCFGDAMAGWGYGRLLVRDVVLLGMAVVVFRNAPREVPTRSVTDRGVEGVASP